MGIFLKRIFNKVGILRFYNIKSNNVTVKVPIFNTTGFANFKDHEPFMDQVLSKLGNSNDHILDIGVNVGQTLIKWKTLFSNASYTGIEPNTICVYYTNLLVAKNNFTNSTIWPIGLSNHTGIQHLYLKENDTSDSTASTINNFRDQVKVKQISIPSFSYKDISTAENKFSIIKIDIEGFELMALESIFPIISDINPFIICEILPVYTANNRERLDRQIKIEKLLKTNNYNMFRILKFNPTEIQKLDTIEIHGDLDLCDYIFVHDNRIDELITCFA